MCGLFSLLQLRWKQLLLALKEAAHWATGGLGWVAVFWILNLHEFEWVSLTAIILCWSLINILHIKVPCGVKVLRHASFLYIFRFNFCYKESVNCNLFEWWQKYVSRLSEDPLKIMLCTLADFFFYLCSVKSLYLTFFNGMLYFLVNTDLYIQFKLILLNYNKDWKIIKLVPNTKYWFSSWSGWWKLLFPLD